MESGFEERKKKHEDKWALDEALRFKAVARRNKLLGLWAAAEMGLTGDEAQAYTKAVVAAEMHPAGAFGKVKADLSGAGLSHTEAAILRKIEELEALAREQIQNAG
jgi:hypothetical protein